MTTTKALVGTFGSVPASHSSDLPKGPPIRPRVDELKRAWSALNTGVFRESSWAPGGAAVRVVGVVGGAGASTVSLAIAEAAGTAVVVDEAGAAESGLIAAGRTELGSVGGWVRSARGNVLIVRRASPTRTAPPTTADLTVIDPGIGSDRAWTAEKHHCPAVYVTTATVPGLRRLELLLADSPALAFAVAVRGERRWASHLSGYLGPATKAAIADGRCVTVPYDRHLAVHGLDTTDLPKPLVAVGGQLLRLLGLDPSPVLKGLS